MTGTAIGYRQILGVPGMASLLGVSFLARTAITADAMALTMYVVLGLRLSYGAAGAVVASLTAGLALGGPLLGRVIDRWGLRPVVLVTVAVQAVFWLAVPVLPYGALLAAAFVAGALMVPASSVTRQGIAAMTAAGQRRAAFALESVQGELSYMVGPAVVILCAAQTSPGKVVWGVGAAIVVGGLGIALLDPPLRAASETADQGQGQGQDQGRTQPGSGAAAEATEATAPRAGKSTGPGPGPGAGTDTGRPRRREWLGTGMIAVLTMVLGTTMLLGGVDLAIVATLQASDQVAWASAVVAVLAVASVTGGLLYGVRARPLPIWLLLGLLGLVTVPAGLARDWPWLCLAVVPTGFLTAPTLSALADALARLAPPGVRGEAMGLHSSAQSVGFALGSAVIGVAIDASAPAGGFAAAGLAGLGAALGGCLLARRAPLPRPGTPETAKAKL
ncbi:MFS transporter [Streptomyces sp. NPDC046203]|uniref:MFS transporter n=1 Tax=Streptomyces sp. NPDC046203 TaxID=3154602 RepID=UPI00340C4F90